MLTASLKAVTSALGYAQLTTLDTTARNLPSIPTRDKNGLTCLPRLAIVQVTGKSCRWRDDGTDPDAATGMTIYVGDTLYYDGDITRIKFIEVSATAVLNVSYYA